MPAIPGEVFRPGLELASRQDLEAYHGAVSELRVGERDTMPDPNEKKGQEQPGAPVEGAAPQMGPAPGKASVEEVPGAASGQVTRKQELEFLAS